MTDTIHWLIAQIRVDRSLPRLRRGRRECRDPRRLLRPPESVRALADIRCRFRSAPSSATRCCFWSGGGFRTIRLVARMRRKPGFAHAYRLVRRYPNLFVLPTATSTARARRRGRCWSVRHRRFAVPVDQRAVRAALGGACSAASAMSFGLGAERLIGAALARAPAAADRARQEASPAGSPPISPRTTAHAADTRRASKPLPTIRCRVRGSAG